MNAASDLHAPDQARPAPGFGRAALGLLSVVFFSANALLAGSVLWGHDVRAKGLCVLAVLAAAAFVRFGRARRFAPYLFGFSGVFFGYQPYTYYAVAFVFLCAVAGAALTWRNLTAPSGEALSAAVPAPRPAREGRTFYLLCAFAASCVFSLLTLPGGQFLEALQIFGPMDFYRMAVFSPAAQAPYPLAAVNRLLVVALFAVEFSRAQIPGKYRSLALGLCCGALGVTILGFLEFFHGGSFILHYRFQSIFANPGWYAEYAVICAPFFLLYLKPPSLAPRFLGYAGLSCLSVAVVLTLARAGWLALGLSLCAAAWLTLTDNPFVRFDRKKGVLPAVIAAYLCLAVLSFWVGGKQLSYFSRPINALLKERVSNFADSPRPRLFLTGLAIGSENPLFGLGFESYALRYPALLDARDSALAGVVKDGDEVFETAHNLYVQLFAGSGLVGLFLWIGVAVCAGSTLYGNVRRSRSLMDLCMLLALAAFHLYGFFQNMFYVPAATLLVFFVLARAMSLERAADGVAAQTGKAGPLKGLAVAAAVLCLVGYAYDPGLSKLAARRGLASLAPENVPLFAGMFGPEAMDSQSGYWSCGASRLFFGKDGPDSLLARTVYPDPQAANARIEIWSADRLVDAAGFRDSGWIRLRAKSPGATPSALYLISGPVYYPNVFGAAGDHRPLASAFIPGGELP